MSSPPSFLSQLKQHREAEMQSAKIAKGLAKAAEKKLAYISTALDQYALKYKEEFPVTEYQKDIPATEKWREQISAEIFPNLKINIGIPDQSGFYHAHPVPIIENRFVACEHYDKKDIFVCQTLTSPTKYFEINKNPLQKPSNVINTEIWDNNFSLLNYVQINAKTKADIQIPVDMMKKLQNRVVDNMQSSEYWYRANAAIDDFQTILIRRASRSKQKMNEYSDYLSKQPSQASFTL